MKKILFLLLILFPALLYAQPSIKFESEIHDFGSVKQGDQLEFAFEFTSAGTEDLSIKHITTS